MLEWIKIHCVGIGIVSIVCCFLWGKRITEYYVGSAEIWAEMVSSCSEGVKSLESQIFGKSQPQSQPVQEVEPQKTHLESQSFVKSKPQSQPVQEVVAPPKTYLELGNECYENGEFTDARKYYYKMATFQGSAEAQYKLAICYELGRGGKTDLKSAVYYYGLAAKQGYPGAEQKRAEVQERLTPKPCTKCSGKGAVIVPAKKKCTKCQNGRIATRSCRNCLDGWCTNTEALVYPSVKKRYQWIVDTNRNTEYRSVNGVSERLGQILKSKSEAENRLLNGPHMNISMMMSSGIIGESESGKKNPTLERLSNKTGKRINRHEFDQLKKLQYLPQGVSKTMGLLHIVPCGNRERWYSRGSYDCANLGKENEHIPSPKNECSECRPCSQCGGDLLCDQCDGSGLFMGDCKECENGYVSQSMTVDCDHCGGDGKIEPEY